MPQNSSRTAGRHFLQIPGPTPVPDRILRAMDMPMIDHRGPEFARLGQARARRHQDDLQVRRPGDHLSGLRHRRLGGGARQRALARRPRADGRDRPLRHAVEGDGAEARPRSRSSSRPTGAPAPTRRRSRRGCATTRRTRIKAVCVVHNETSTGCVSHIGEVRKAIDAARHPALLDGRHHLVARLDRLSPRRMGRRRHRRRLAEGADAAARPVVQRARRQGAGRRQGREAAEIVLVVGGDDRQQPATAISPIRRRPTCSTGSPRRSTCCTRRGSTTSSRATTATPRRRAARCAPGAWKSGAASRATIRPRSPRC